MDKFQMDAARGQQAMSEADIAAKQRSEAHLAMGAKPSLETMRSMQNANPYLAEYESIVLRDRGRRHVARGRWRRFVRFFMPT